MMRAIVSAGLLAACGPHATPSSTPGAAAGGEGIYAEDVDRTADPCTDFYEFANGAWRARNPIPPSMARWSRRWEAGETAKEQLKEILDEVSATHDWPKGSVEQLIGDFYGACMDEARVDALGVEPIQPLLAEIDGDRRTRAGVAADDRAGSTSSRSPCPSASPPARTTTTPTRRHRATSTPSGLGLPGPRLLREARAALPGGAREVPRPRRAHVRARRDEPRGVATRRRTPSSRMEKQLAEASLDNVALRDPKATDHKTTLRRAARKLTPNFDWAALLRRREAPARPPLNVAAAGVPEGDRPAAPRDAARRLEGVPARGTSLRSAAPYLSTPFVEENFAFNEQYLGGAKEMKPRWKRCVGVDRQPARRGARPEVRREVLPARGQGAHAGAGEEPARSRWATRSEGLDWMSPETKAKAPREALDLQPEDRLSRQVEGLPQRARSGATRYWANVVAGRALERRRRPRADRQAGRPRPLGHDAADVERLLQPAR